MTYEILCALASC